MYSKQTDIHQYLRTNSCHLKNQTENIPIGVAEIIRTNCSDNVINDITFKRRAIEYKVYFVKSEKDTDIAFCRRVTINRRERSKKKPKRKQNNKMKFITEYEPSLPNICRIWGKTNRL